MNSRLMLLAIGLSFSALALPSRGAAQIGGMIRGAVDRQIERKIDDAVSCAFNDSACIKKAQADGKKVTVVDKGGKPVKDQAGALAKSDSAGDGTSASNAPPGKGAWLNYDFIPGERVLFYDDFANDKVGDLPVHEDVSHGNVTIVDIKGRRFLHTVTGADMTISLPEVLPTRFTVELVYHRHGGNGMGLFLHFGPDDREMRFRCDQGNASIYGTGANGPKEATQEVPGVGENDLETCRLMVDGGYAKAYVNAVRVAQLNGLVFTRENKIAVELPNADDNGALITSIRIAAGGKKLWDGLAADGRVRTQGIFFDVTSDRIRGESTPTLIEIGDMLKQHPDLNITIEGHTDNTGTGAGNQTLSERRAASVRQYLITAFGIDGSRLKSAGFGATKPTAPNDTPEGRQNNRRVELVKN